MTSRMNLTLKNKLVIFVVENLQNLIKKPPDLFLFVGSGSGGVGGDGGGGRNGGGSGCGGWMLVVGTVEGTRGMTYVGKATKGGRSGGRGGNGVAGSGGKAGEDEDGGGVVKRFGEIVFRI
ncbi:glycine-rich cell wall structural protein 1-like [Daucus carota subsp. sativus]|uniref:glycine-rich cell wall structural protein 1-like n=1 Tax=Daucus carota subsp. sativus TaxID=79200 RepID=UPI0030835353